MERTEIKNQYYQNYFEDQNDKIIQNSQCPILPNQMDTNWNQSVNQFTSCQYFQVDSMSYGNQFNSMSQSIFAQGSIPYQYHVSSMQFQQPHMSFYHNLTQTYQNVTNVFR